MLLFLRKVNPKSSFTTINDNKKQEKTTNKPIFLIKNIYLLKNKAIVESRIASWIVFFMHIFICSLVFVFHILKFKVWLTVRDGHRI